MNDYTFNINDTERWFDVLLAAGHIQPLQPRNPLQPGDENKPDFCRYHRWVHHPTNRCRPIMEKIQDMMDQGLLEYEKILPEKKAAAMWISITNKSSSFAETDEAESHIKHGANLECLQGS